MVGHEYVALHGEIVEHTRGLYVLLAGTMALLATGISAGFTVWNNAIASASIFNFAILILLATAGLATLQIGMQMVSIGAYIKTEIEDKIQALLGNELKAWENDRGSMVDTPAKPSRVMGWQTQLFSEGNKPGAHAGATQDLRFVGILFNIAYIAVTVIGEIRIFSSGWESVGCTIRWVIGLVPLPIALFGVLAAYFLYRNMPTITMAGKNRRDIQTVE